MYMPFMSSQEQFLLMFVEHWTFASNIVVMLELTFSPLGFTVLCLLGVLFSAVSVPSQAVLELPQACTHAALLQGAVGFEHPYPPQEE